MRYRGQLRCCNPMTFVHHRSVSSRLFVSCKSKVSDAMYRFNATGVMSLVIWQERLMIACPDRQIHRMKLNLKLSHFVKSTQQRYTSPVP